MFRSPKTILMCALAAVLAATLAAGPLSGEEAPPPQPYPTISQETVPLEGDFLYQVVMLRAAPGRLLELIELLKEERDLFGDARELMPFWMRHTQGDQWDLMILYPMGSFHEYYEPERMARRLESGEQKGLSEAQLRLEADLLTSWRDELFVRGPEPDVLAPLFDDNGFYHVEMFVALPGRRRGLLEERRMENHYLRELGRPQNVIFVREAGGPWDSFTLGFFRDLIHFAESAEIPEEAEDRAARAAGFERAGAIGNYMRSLILYHHDTLLVAIR